MPSHRFFTASEGEYHQILTRTTPSGWLFILFLRHRVGSLKLLQSHAATSRSPSVLPFHPRWRPVRQNVNTSATAIRNIVQNKQMKKRSPDCSNERFDLKKGGYLLSRIALFDTVYHRCMEDMVVAISHITQNEQMKKRSLDCSNERFDLKKGGYLLSRIALQYHRRKWA